MEREVNQVEGEGQKQLVTFNLAGEEYGIDIIQVHEIKRLKEISITKVPRAPQFVEGVINLRGDVIPVLDLRKRFDLGENKMDRETRIIVVHLDGKSIGVLVDKVNEVLTVDNSSIDDPPQEVMQIESYFISGIAKKEDRLVILLDILNILSPQEEAEVAKLTE